MRRLVALAVAVGALGQLTFSFGYLYGMRTGMALTSDGAGLVRVYP